MAENVDSLSAAEQDSERENSSAFKDIQLINAVKKNEVLWNTTLTSFSDSTLRNLTWLKIEKELLQNKPGMFDHKY
jgi:Alcohol dehydrogenase transcription factor Myb/SANT-like